MVKPDLTAPGNGVLLDNLRPEFDWSDVPGASSYTIQVSSSISMSSPIVNATVTASSYVPTKDLTKNKMLYWRVIANGANGPSSSAARPMLSPNTPTTPSLVSPAANALLTGLAGLRPRLDWSNSTLPTGTVFKHYELQLATDSAFTTGLETHPIPDSITASEYTLTTDLLTNTRYYWRVRTFNTTGHSSWSAVRYFREAMLPPVLVTPGDGSTLSTLRPSFNWEDVPGADSYTIQISASSTMSSPSVNATVTPSEYIPTKDLTRNKILNWRVRANGVNGPSAWSDVWTITVSIP
jgi:hypothetical protein